MNCFPRTLKAMLIGFVMFSGSQYASAATQVVWQIGKFDKSSVEFTAVVPPAAKTTEATAQADVVYTLGKSKAETDWPGKQPGASNGQEGFRRHPYAIQFELSSAPQGLYTLKVGLLVECPRLSRLEVEINGHHALYYQHPALDYSGGNVLDAFLPNYSYSVISAEIPTKFLHRGNNQLVLTANDSPTDRDNSTNSGLVYD